MILNTVILAGLQDLTEVCKHFHKCKILWRQVLRDNSVSFLTELTDLEIRMRPLDS